jgi:hypothetical protein
LTIGTASDILSYTGLVVWPVVILSRDAKNSSNSTMAQAVMQAEEDLVNQSAGDIDPKLGRLLRVSIMNQITLEGMKGASS